MRNPGVVQSPQTTSKLSPAQDVHTTGSMLEMFAAQVKQHPASTAVQCAGKTLTYRELDQRANQLANYLRRAGIGPEMRVGVWLPRSLDLVVSLFAIIKAGAAYVPLDMNYPQERVAYMLEDAQAPLLLTLENTESLLPSYCGRKVLLDQEAEQIDREPELPPNVPIDPENIAYLIYTSGSTGRPKGVAIRHKSVISLLEWTRETYSSDELSGVVASTSICFDMSVFEIFGTLSCGGHVILVENALGIAGLREPDHATLIDTVPSAIAELLRIGGLPRTVKTVNMGGEALASSLVKQAYQEHSVQRVYNLYGPSEDTTFSSCELVLKDEPAAIAPIGVPVNNTQFYVLNYQMMLVPDGETGELYIGGDGLARGYLNRPELTAARFVPDPVSGISGARLYYTGDRVRVMRDGRFEYLGRIDHQVKIRGYRIELGEIEATLNAYPGVENSVVVAHGESTGNKRLVAYVVNNGKQQVRATELRSYVQQKVPEYMVPSQFVILGQLPLTPNGKVDRHALPAPERSGESEVMPQTPMQSAIADACSRVLGLPSAPLDSIFLELGGSSLNATRVIADVRERTGLSVPIRSLLGGATLLEIAQELEQQGAGESTQSPRPKPGVHGPIPAAYSQERIWFIQRMDPEALAYHFSARIRFLGKLDKAALENALSSVIERHEIYRTTLFEVDGKLLQIVHQPWKVQLETIDVEDGLCTEEEILRESQRPFDLTALPLARWKLIKKGPEDHALLVVEHHVIHDGWAFNVFLSDLTEFYRAYSCGESPRLGPVSLQFADFARWQTEWMESQEARQQLEYWAQTLAGVPSLLQLPCDRCRPARQTYVGDVLRFRINDELESALAAATRSNHVTLFMLFAAALEILLYRYSQQEDFCIGTGIANRRWEETKTLTGMLVNNIPIRARINPELNVSDVLERVKETLLDAYNRQDVPFDAIVKAVNPVRDSSHNPIFQVMLGFHDSPLNCASLGDTHLIVEQALANGSAKFDLNVIMIPPQNHNLPPGYKAFRELLWEYNTSLFDRATAEQMQRHLIRVLREVARDSAQQIRQISMLEEAELKQVLVEWNQTERSYPEACVHQLFEQQVSRTPSSPAVAGKGTQLSYAELNEMASRTAHYLQKIGVVPQAFVGILMERSPEMIVATLAILKAGAVYVPLDISHPAERLSFMIQDSEIKVLLTDRELNKEITRGQPELQVLNLEKEKGQIAAERPSDLPCLITNHHLAYVMYTSGSTGIPKGIAIEHRNIVRLVKETGYVNLGSDDRVAQIANASFDAATFEFWGALLNGGCLVGIDRDTSINPSELAKRIQSEKITAMFLTTALFNQIAREVPDAFAGVRYLLFGGEASDPQCAASVLQAGPPAQFTHVYGPTEATTFSTWFVIRGLEADATTIPIGRPLTNAQMYVLDSWLQPVPLGVRGELFIGGEGVGRGYLGRAELTAEKFVPDPFAQKPGARLYRTGDLVRWRRDGNLEFVARIDGQIKIRGFRVELGEIESILAQVPGIAQTAVLLREDAPGEKRLVAYVVVAEGSSPLDTTMLREHLKTKLPDYMVPAAFVELSSLPLTINGKIDRALLPAPHYLGDVYRAPRTPQEEILCGIFSEVLAAERVGIDDNFFNLGGHSLLATRLVSRVRALLGVELPLRKLFELPTVAGVAAQLRQAEKAGVPLVRQQRPERLPLSYAQQRLWFIDQLQGGSTEYNMVEALRLRGELDRNALERALAAIVERHEVLRTRFVEMEGRAVQVITPELRLRVPLEDLSGMSRASKEQRVEAALWREREQPFDLGRGPMLRLRLLKLGEREHVLLRSFHHIVSDGWSQGIFNRELAELYGACRRGEESSGLEPLGVQYADFALWQRQRLDEEAMGRELGYWKEQLAGIPGQLELPRDRPRQARQTFAAQLYREVLGKEELAGLKEVGQKGQATLYMVLLACFAVLLERYSGQEDIVVGTPIANRQEAQLEQLMGFFVNSLVMRVKVKEEERFRELLEQVRETALAAYGHQELPFERLVEELSPERSLNTTPLYQVMFALQNAPAEEQELAGLEVERIRSGRMTVRFDLELHAWERAGEIELNWVYNPDLFDAWRIEQMAHHYMRLLKDVPRFIDRPLTELELLSHDEQSQLLELWAIGEREPVLGSDIYQLFEEQVSKTPEELAAADQERTLTYAQLHQWTSNIGWILHKQGVGPEVKVAVCLERSVAMIAALLGVLKAGGAYVPIDPDYPSNRVEFMLRDSDARVLLTEKALLPKLPAQRKQIILIEEIGEIGEKSFTEKACRISPENLAYVIYTSGSTGTPKGVAIRHSSAVAFLKWARRAFSPEELKKVLASTSLCFDLSIFEIFVPLISGGVVLVVRNILDLTTFPPESLTLINTVPSAMRELVRLNALPKSVRTVNLAGEQLAADLVKDIYHLKHVDRVVNLYGPSEDTTYSTYGVLPEIPADIRVLIGKPVSNTRVYVLDERLKPAPIGVAGELYIGGAGLARGYLGRPDLTAERFIADPFGAAGERLYRTGDLVRWRRDGVLDFLGRLDHQVKVRGFRIEPGEIESALKSRPGVRDALVMARDNGSGGTQLVGYVVPEDREEPDGAALRQSLRESLPDYMIPASLVVLPQWPLTPNGKVDRRALPEPNQHSGSYREPSTEEEGLLCQLFAEVLGIERVGVDDNFFNLGGHSLMATLLVSRIRATLGNDLPVHAIFEMPTVAELAKTITLEQQQRSENATPADRIA